MKNRNSRIKKALEEANVSQAKLAELLGVSRASVSERLSKGSEIDSIEFLTAVVSLTGYDFNWLLTGEGDGSKVIPNAQETGLRYESKSIEALEKLVDTQARTIKLLEETIIRLEETITRQSKTGV
jgi:transcriptional regulator with XRE-family HTH domain